jgi:magnesium-transporting ATPase (P-type)
MQRSPMALGATVVEGLTTNAAHQLAQQHGYHEVAPHPEHPWRQFLGKFWGLSAWMLELIMILSALPGRVSDIVVVATLLVVNAILGFAAVCRQGLSMHHAPALSSA